MNDILLFSGGLDSTVVLQMLWLMKKTPTLLYICHTYIEGEREAVQKYQPQMVTVNLPPPQEYTAFVPLRNAVFLSVAASWAMHLAKSENDPITVYTGMYYDPMQFDYKDTNPIFHALHSEAIRYLEPALEFKHPLQGMSKAEVVEMAHSMGLSMGDTWSCYDPVALKPCGICGACKKRREAYDRYMRSKL